MKNRFWNRLLFSVCAASVLFSAPALIAAWSQHPTPPPPQPKPSPNAPISQNAPEGLEGTPHPVDRGKPSVNQQNEIDLRLDVQRLYAMATELKDEVDQTNENAVLNVAVLKRAQEIEKLAKQIRDRAKH
jgi:hypothetical protein